MSRFFDESFSKLSEKSSYDYDLLVDIYNITKYYEYEDWDNYFKNVTLNRGWWDEFDFQIGERIFIQEGDDIYEGIIDDLDVEDNAIRILYKTDNHGEKIRWISFEEYIETLATILMED